MSEQLYQEERRNPGQLSAASSAAVLLQLCMGLRASQALSVAAQLGIADHLAGGALTSVALATATQTHPESLRRLLRALTALNIFVEQENDMFILTPVGHLLRRDHPQSLRSRVLFLTGEVRWRCWADLLGSVQSGEAATERVLGMSLFDYYAAHPEESLIHDNAMAEASALTGPAILHNYDFSRFPSVVDVGGGSGQLLCTILKENPSLNGVLFDLPHVVAGAEHLLTVAGVGDRCQIVGGSFFASVPSSGNMYLLKQIIHDWDDVSATQILAACRKAIPSDGTLLVIERVLPQRASPGEMSDAFLIDLEMLTMTPGGRERTEHEFRELLAGAGFALTRVISTGSPLSMLEARPV